MIKRFARLDVATADLAESVSTYQKNFEFTVQPTNNSNEAIIDVGGAQIRLRTGAAAADMVSPSGEGLAAVWLEADDVEQVAETLRRANVVTSPVRVEGDRRILAVNPTSANMVPLFIFERL
jgi:hypothetical protein